MSTANFKVYLTPLVAPNIYGAIVDITADIRIEDFIERNGIGKIKFEVDSGDYDIGVFTYANVDLNVINFSGKFNDQNDPRSLFPVTRDRAKVVITYTNTDNDETTLFAGLINDEATRQDFFKQETRFVILSYDSIFRKTKVSGGLVKDGDLFSQAIIAIVNRPEITSILNFSAPQIVVDLDRIIDIGSFFDEKSSREALDLLLLASNSVLLVDDTNTIVVRRRTENSNSPYQFFGAGDLLGREDIINITNYNTGLQRAFNTIEVNDITSFTQAYIDEFAVRRKSFRLEFIISIITAQDIADNIIYNFQTPKEELEMVIAIERSKDIKILDAISIDLPVRVRGYHENTVPLYDIAKYDEGIYSYEFGSFVINPEKTWKVIGITYNVKPRTAVLKLRVVGITEGDGIFVPFFRISAEGDSRITAASDFRINP